MVSIQLPRSASVPSLCMVPFPDNRLLCLLMGDEYIIHFTLRALQPLGLSDWPKGVRCYLNWSSGLLLGFFKPNFKTYIGNVFITYKNVSQAYRHMKKWKKRTMPPLKKKKEGRGIKRQRMDLSELRPWLSLLVFSYYIPGFHNHINKWIPFFA